MGRKTTIWLLQVRNWQDCTQEELDKAKKGEPQKKN